MSTPYLSGTIEADDEGPRHSNFPAGNIGSNDVQPSDRRTPVVLVPGTAPAGSRTHGSVEEGGIVSLQRT
jgi:hypothetical protein